MILVSFFLQRAFFDFRSQIDNLFFSSYNQTLFILSISLTLFFMWQRFQGLFGRIVAVLGRYPATSFFVLLALLFGVIALGNFLRTPDKLTDNNALIVKETKLFDTESDTAYVTLPAKVKKENVVQITALARGIVSAIHTSPGRSVAAGQTLLTLTNDYQSGSFAIQKNLAEESARLAQELASIDKRITALEEKKIKRDDTLSNTEEALELEQLKRDRAVRKSNLEQSSLSVQLAHQNDAQFKPKTFTSGVVESIRVRRGDLVSAGDVIATLSTPRGTATLEAFLDQETARLFDVTKEAHVTIGDKTVTLRPTYVSQAENENGLFSVLFHLSENMRDTIVSGEYLQVSLPLKSVDDFFFLIPLDAIFQDDNRASLLVERDGKAASLTVELGNIHGGFAEVRSGLSSGDRVILNRAVVTGDTLSVTQ